MPALRNALPAAIFIASLTCCGSGGSVGPCVHIFREPILHLTRVTDAARGVSVASVRLSAITIEGESVDAAGLLVHGPSLNVALVDSAIVCRVPCGIGTQSGRWAFTLSAAGYAPARVTLDDVRYRTHHGGCPSYADAGTRVELALQPAR